MSVKPGEKPSREQIEANKEMRQPGESELDYYDRRYKERVCFNFSCLKFSMRYNNKNVIPQMRAERTSRPKPVQSSPYDSDAKLQKGYRK